MNCTDVRQNLSAYIDGMLDRQIKDMVDEHLSTCKACSQELNSMRSLVKELGDMGDIKAPEDFLETLHERLETVSLWTRIKEMFFVPAQIRIPLEFATLSIIGVLTFALYSIYSPQDEVASLVQDRSVESAVDRAYIREMESEPSALSPATDEDEAIRYVQAAKQQPIELALMLPQKAETEGSGPAGDKKQTPLTAAAGPAERRKDVGLDGYKAREAGKALPGVKADEALEKPAMDATGRAAKKQATIPPEESPPLRDSFEIVGKLHELIGLSAGRILSEELDRKDRIILAEVPAGQYGDFIEKIPDIARFKETPPAIPADRKAPVLIRIRLVPEQ